MVKFYSDLVIKFFLSFTRFKTLQFNKFDEIAVIKNQSYLLLLNAE